MQVYITIEAAEAYTKGVANGTIDDPIERIFSTVMDQEIVSYCSSKGTYSFDAEDFK